MLKLAYVSRAAPWLTPEGVQEIVEHSQQKNARLGVTGFLCLRDGMFVQYLEGDDDTVRGLMATIHDDPRHEVFKSVELGCQPHRNFHGWSMRYLDNHFLGQLAIEDLLEGVLLEFGRGVINELTAHAMAHRLVTRIAAAAV